MLQIVVDGSFQLLDTMEYAAADALLGDEAEEAFHLVEPGGRGGREVHVVAWVAGEPCLDLGMLVRGIIVGNQVQVALGTARSMPRRKRSHS